MPARPCRHGEGPAGRNVGHIGEKVSQVRPARGAGRAATRGREIDHGHRHPRLTIPLVSARGLVRTHGSGGSARSVVDGIDLTVEGGEMLAIVGASGSGKSTLLHLLAGLDRPTRGSVEVQGTRLDHGSQARLARFRRRAIGVVFQSFRLVPELTAWENALLPARLAHDIGAGRGRAAELFDRLGVSHVARQLPPDLSGGEQQRVAIARALIMEPVVVFADEPTGNLDEASGGEVLGLLRAAVTPGRAVVMVTHDAGHAADADRVIRLRDGRISP